MGGRHGRTRQWPAAAASAGCGCHGDISASLSRLVIAQASCPMALQQLQNLIHIWRTVGSSSEAHAPLAQDRRSGIPLPRWHASPAPRRAAVIDVWKAAGSGERTEHLRVSRAEHSALLVAERQRSHEAASTSSQVAHIASKGSSRNGASAGSETKVPHGSSHGGEARAQRQPQRAAQLKGGSVRRRHRPGISGRQGTYTSAHITSFLGELANGLGGDQAEAALARACKGAAKAGLGSEAVALLRQLEPDLALTKPWTATAIIEVHPHLPRRVQVTLLRMTHVENGCALPGY